MSLSQVERLAWDQEVARAKLAALTIFEVGPVRQPDAANAVILIRRALKTQTTDNAWTAILMSLSIGKGVRVGHRG